MAKPDRPLSLALANLRRPRWPSPFPDFGTPPLSPVSQTPLLTADEAIRLALVFADRTTCRLSRPRVERFARSATPRTLVIHAVDAEPGVPLLTLWMRHHVEAMGSLAEHLAREYACTVLFVLPDDLPGVIRRSLAALGSWRGVDGSYPGGHWRLMARSLRMNPACTLIVDAVAATDWIHAMTVGAAAPKRPVAVSTLGGGPASYHSVQRDTPVGLLADDANHDHETWFAGPRLADRAADATIGDGQLTFYREVVGDRSSSECIRCGACIEICPTRVDPVALLRAHVAAKAATPHRERRLEHAGLPACIDCGLCTSVCPSNIELHHAIAELKAAHPRPADA